MTIGIWLKQKHMKYLLLTSAFAVATLFSMGQNQRDAAAQQALRSYKQLLAVQPDKNTNMGDTALWILGTPLKTAIVPLDKLKEYKAGDPAKDLIMNNDNVVIFPVINSRSRQVVSAITVERKGEKWMPASFGKEKNILEKIDSIGGAERNYTLVKILAFNLNFLSYEESGTVQFIPLQDDRQRDIVQGRPLPAEKILERYVKPANDYNGLPL